MYDVSETNYVDSTCFGQCKPCNYLGPAPGALRELKLMEFYKKTCAECSRSCFGAAVLSPCDLLKTHVQVVSDTTLPHG